MYRRIRRARPVSARRKVVFARETFSRNNFSDALGTFNVLSAFETEYGGQLAGATLIGGWGWATSHVLNTVTGLQTAYSWGLFMSKLQLADLAAGHPDPGFHAANNDRYGSWIIAEQIPLFPISTGASLSVGSSQPVQEAVERHRWFFKTKRKLSQLEDQLVLAIRSGPGSAGQSAMDVQISMTLKIMLP